MKLKCEILSVDTIGDRLTLKLQGQEPGAADWRPWCSVSLQIPQTARNCKAFHVGRAVVVELTAK